MKTVKSYFFQLIKIARFELQPACYGTLNVSNLKKKLPYKLGAIKKKLLVILPDPLI